MLNEPGTPCVRLPLCVYGGNPSMFLVCDGAVIRTLERRWEHVFMWYSTLCLAILARAYCSGKLSEAFMFTAEQRLHSKVRRVLTWIDSSS